MSTRRRVAVTYEETSPGVPYWGPNTVTTDLLPDQTDVAIENLVSGRTYYVKSWTEDQFGNKSREIVRVVITPQPTKAEPLSFSANGYLDSGSPMRAFVKVPSSVKSVSEALVTLAFRQFMAPATAASSGGGSTSGSSSASSSGASDTTSSGSSSASSSSNGSASFGLAFHATSGTSGAASAGTAHTHGAGTFGDANAVNSDGGHSHPIPHTHNIPHTHGISHTHSTPAHTHGLTYGTFEETMPATHSVVVTLYKRSGAEWNLVHTSTAITADLADIDYTGIITGAGDYRFEVISEAAQPNDGRLGLDLFGALSIVV